MSPDLPLLSYALVSLLGAMSPGADFALVTRYASLYGKRSGIFTAFGVAGGMAVNTTAAVCGLGALLIASHQLYVAVTLAGAAYLAYLGIRILWSLRAKGGGAETAQEQPSKLHTPWSAFRRGFIVNILNPKPVIFLVALMPQFLPKDPTVPDRIALGLATVLTVLSWFVVVAIGFALLKKFFERPAARKTFNALTGTVLILLGVKIALS